ncbi:MAG: undecaprenyl-diphosphate phosphatase [Candidatus Bathyarchaeia archaeon]|jgi:undecaprenyl-diphosphatase
MDLLQSITLGLIQGTTEWFPISSTGNLRVAEYFFGLTVPLVFDVLLHFGTLLVILVYFRGAIKKVLTALWHRDFHSQDGKLIVPIIAGTIPTVLIALVFGDQLDANFNTLNWLGVWFLVSGAILLTTRRTKEQFDSISVSTALFVGVMQGLAIIPSVSRSGFTIAAMLLLGVKRDLAFKFSFLLSIPAIFGAVGLTLFQEHSMLSTAGIGTFEITAALAVAVAVSFVALKILEKSLAAKKFYLFSIYCFAAGAVMFALNFLGF